MQEEKKKNELRRELEKKEFEKFYQEEIKKMNKVKPKEFGQGIEEYDEGLENDIQDMIQNQRKKKGNKKNHISEEELIEIEKELERLKVLDELDKKDQSEEEEIKVVKKKEHKNKGKKI